MSAKAFDEIIFLVSLPRSGSTLMQALLATSPSIYTTSEPWFALRELFPLVDKRYSAIYDTKEEYKAFNNLINQLPDGESTYHKLISKKVYSLYDQILEKAGVECVYFLDKTPRYYLILESLFEVFKNARFIIIKRHPLDVFVSIYSKWIREDWFKFQKYKYDLTEGIYNINNFVDKYGKEDNVYIYSYEDIVDNFDETIHGMEKSLNISLDKNKLAEGFDKIKNSYAHGDNISFSANRTSKYNWTNESTLKFFAPLFLDYINLLDNHSIEKFGYDSQFVLDKVKEAAGKRLLPKFIYPNLIELLDGDYNVNSLIFRARKKMTRLGI